MKQWILIILVGLFGYTTVKSQEIYLVNPSFEGQPNPGLAPEGWIDCGMTGETPPDTHPAPPERGNFFNVVAPSQHGQTYLGLVVRGNDTWERVAQKLNKPLSAGQCYKFNLQLAKSPSYLSLSKSVGREVEFNEPVVIRLWAGNDYCSQGELLDETDVIDHSYWQEYNFEFTTAREFRYFMIEAFYKTPVLFPYRGNVLLDNCSPIVACSQEMPVNEPIAAVVPDKPKVNVPPRKDPPKKEPVTKNSPKADPKPPVTKNPPDIVYTPPISTPKPRPKVDPQPSKPKIIPDLNQNIKEGQKIRVEKLFFAADSSKINPDSYEALDEIYSFLKLNKYVKVEIGGHTNGRPSHDWADRLSTKRAVAVAHYLKRKGISKDRITTKGYGKREPIASDNTDDGRRRNQRVEIKILSIDRQ